MSEKITKEDCLKAIEIYFRERLENNSPLKEIMEPKDFEDFITSSAGIAKAGFEAGYQFAREEMEENDGTENA